MIELEVGQVTKIGEFYLARVEEKNQIYELNKILTVPQSTPEYISFLVQGIIPGAAYTGPITPGMILPAEAYAEMKHLFYGVFMDSENYAEWLLNSGVGFFLGAEVYIPPQDAHKQEGPTIVAEAPFIYKNQTTEIEITAGQYVVVFDRLFVDKRAGMEDDPLRASIQEFVSEHDIPGKLPKLHNIDLKLISRKI